MADAQHQVHPNLPQGDEDMDLHAQDQPLTREEIDLILEWKWNPANRPLNQVAQWMGTLPREPLTNLFIIIAPDAILNVMTRQATTVARLLCSIENHQFKLRKLLKDQEDGTFPQEVITAVSIAKSTAERFPEILVNLRTELLMAIIQEQAKKTTAITSEVATLMTRYFNDLKSLESRSSIALPNNVNLHLVLTEIARFRATTLYRDWVNKTGNTYLTFKSTQVKKEQLNEAKKEKFDAVKAAAAAERDKPVTVAKLAQSLKGLGLKGKPSSSTGAQKVAASSSSGNAKKSGPSKAAVTKRKRGNSDQTKSKQNGSKKPGTGSRK